MSSNQEEHFILTSYATPASGSPPPPALSAVAYTNTPKQDARLCVVASGVGLGFFDSTDQTPLSSITLGPSFLPTTNAVSRSTPAASAGSIRIKGARKTWVGIQQGEAGEVWCWMEEERKDGSTEGEAAKVAYPTPAPLSAIAAPRTLPQNLILLSSTGALSLAAEADLSLLATLDAPSSAPLSQSLQTYPISSTSSFIPSHILSLMSTPPRAHLLFVVRTYATSSSPTSLVEIGKKKFKKTKRPSSAAVIEEVENGETVQEAGSEIEVVYVDPQVTRDGESRAGIVSLGKVVVPGTQVGVSEDGFVSALGANGSLESYRLSFSATSSFASTYADLFTPLQSSSSHLSLTPLTSLPLSPTALTSSNTTLLPLHSSFVLLTSVRPGHKPTTAEDTPTKVVALIFDVRLGAVVSASDINIPSAAFSSPLPSARALSLALYPLSYRAVSLVVSPTSGPGGRSIIFVHPLSLPSASVLAAVVGKHALTARYLAKGDSIAVKAKKTEPMRHPRTSKGKLLLIEASEAARSQLLEELEATMAPLENASGAALDGAIEKAEAAFKVFVEGEKERLVEYALKKLHAAEEKEKERRIAALQEKDRLQTSTKKYRVTRRRIEDAIAKTREEVIWTEVTAKRIKGVSDVYRYKYYEVRKKLEEDMGQIVVEGSQEKALNAIERLEPTLPSTFVTALLHLCFPGPLAADEDLATPGASKRTWKHPTGIVGYLLERKLVGDGVIDGGVTNYLARAGDWPNIHQALITMPDISEATTVALLKTLVSHHLATADAANRIDVDSTGLPFPPPSLATFLAGFVESPSTPAILREALQQQLSAVEALPVLEALDGWLGWWAKRGGGGGQTDADWKAEGRARPKRLPTNPFAPLSLDEVEEDVTPPRVEDILPVVQAILDAHFVTLLLQRQSHPLLRRLSGHVAAHVALSTDLSTLLGALSIYARTREEQLEASSAQKVQKGELKGFGATMAARVAAQEKHAEVGEYAVDKFWL